MELLRRIRNRLNLKRSINRLNRIGAKAVIGEGTKVTGSIVPNRVRIGKNCKIHFTTFHGEVKVGNYTSLWGPNIDIVAKINPVTIGNFCSIARDVLFQEYNHDHSRFTTYFIEKNLLHNDKHEEEIVSKGRIEIEHDVWIGAKCVILSGAHISTGAVVAANSVVTGFVPPYAIVAGSPAKIIKYRFPEEIREKLLATNWWNWTDEEIKNRKELLEKLCRAL